MAKYGSNSIKIEIDATDGGSLTDITAHVTKLGDITIKKDSVESTPFGVSVEQYLQGIIARREPIQMSGFYDDTASTGPDAILNLGTITHTVTRSYKITLGGSKTITGEVWIEEYKRGTNTGEYHTYDATVRFTGTVTEA